MIKKIKFMLKNFDKITELINLCDDLSGIVVNSKKEVKKSSKRVSIIGVPQEQKAYIETTFKINEK